ncbi:MAG: hypothetical protein A3G33_08805 [Omnitrophica bacterium RIFCSPLOWO2_12_FULL_44_17]|uniref:Glutamate--tRNA ligase n=1 Tax=Candidatus Danuiimicrobium aquiferis TaxID=1801832 RepID=A0A1G1L1C2_9BACT|nr:MAG: hypothetical protein A3B72_08145 [Omnitrophica bacterium RIFCSPHIGHO2_02_FULL_45_28]OGW88512.1 MAG: hypothetical protein A3E74_06615 [Omnitrophica bacterium RIFCSPHIGHO2_12_FULL_44_12]OGW98928.1 MAG: hypothetical protein A3G33_08805 [Omnitrophica bacterium RIFCSPLOWO2_12_FULL_44_17]OGX01776.1 MAG: hypothetical protein A3J12_04930 [Omnitrophica bacterium RIFCSPLOWO2_02_FULL_44_11]
MIPPIRVRFAPSPTGSLHIGGIRTALFNYLFAKHYAGTFLVRIEDTDRERSEKRFEIEILESLKWLGLVWDEYPIRQSERLPFYRDAAARLVSAGLAYEEEGPAGKAVKFKMPETKIKFPDMVSGPIEFDASLFDDLVIIKSDGFPTYHFACVIDDHEMNISHVIRGADHISNTPRQIAIYEAFGWKAPEFAHLPLVFGIDGTLLSKRHGAVSLAEYRKEGYLPVGILNYLALLGWASGGSQELFTLQEIANLFSLEHVSQANARFDTEKLKWLNSEHIRKLSNDDFCARLKTYLQEYEPDGLRSDDGRLNKVMPLYKERIRTFREFMEQACFFFQDEISYDPKAVQQHFKGEETRKMLEEWTKILERDGNFEDPALLEALLRSSAEKLGVKAGLLIHPTRVAISGRSATPGLFETMVILGQNLVLKRLRYVVEYYDNFSENTSSLLRGEDTGGGEMSDSPQPDLPPQGGKGTEIGL